MDLEEPPPRDHKVILLVSSLSSDAVQVQETRRARALLAAKGLLVEEVDGADSACVERRAELWALSGLKGTYPQFFLEDPLGKRLFLGTWKEVEAMNECSSLPPHVLRANPHVQTFDKAFIRARRRPSPTVAVVRGGSGGGGVAMPGYAS